MQLVWSAWRSSLWGCCGFRAGRGRRDESVRGTGRRGRGTCERVRFVERWSCSALAAAPAALLPCEPRGPRARARRAMMQKGENPRHGRCAGRRGRAAAVACGRDARGPKGVESGP